MLEYSATIYSHIKIGQIYSMISPMEEWDGLWSHFRQTDHWGGWYFACTVPKKEWVYSLSPT